MSGTETAILLISGAIAAIGWTSWYVAANRVSRLGAPRGGAAALFVTPPAALALLLAILITAASHDVRAAAGYISMYAVMGAAWLWVGAQLLPFFGLSARDDVLERGNRAAGYAIAGALIGIMVCFAGGNIGDGPGFWVVIFSGALASWTLLACWAILERISEVSEIVTIERDVAAGMRLGGFLAAGGVILGRAVAGNWWSAAATLRDFALVGWPVLVLLAAAVVVERIARPTPARPAPSPGIFGALPALLYISVAAAYVASVGRAA